MNRVVTRLALEKFFPPSYLSNVSVSCMHKFLKSVVSVRTHEAPSARIIFPITVCQHDMGLDYECVCIATPVVYAVGSDGRSMERREMSYPATGTLIDSSDMVVGSMTVMALHAFLISVTAVLSMIWSYLPVPNAGSEKHSSLPASSHIFFDASSAAIISSRVATLSVSGSGFIRADRAKVPRDAFELSARARRPVNCLMVLECFHRRADDANPGIWRCSLGYSGHHESTVENDPRSWNRNSGGMEAFAASSFASSSMTSAYEGDTGACDMSAAKANI
ncbi:hypothetical protein KCU62_g157, partial [Aureobasidium sp. EXF-3399]